jgi:hypothetical protein
VEFHLLGQGHPETGREDEGQKASKANEGNGVEAEEMHRKVTKPS